MKPTNALLLTAALGGLLLAANAHADETGGAAATTDTQGQCWGVNSCKGTGACAGKGHSCAGENACKGQGWLKMTEKDCKEKGGEFKAK